MKHLVGAIFSILIGVPFYFIVMDRTPPYQELHAIALTPVVKPGGVFAFELEGIVLKHCAGIIRREFVDSEGKIHAVVPVPPLLAGTIGKPVTLRREIVLPSTVASGDIEYWGFPSYECNPFQFLWPIKLKPTRIKFKVEKANAAMRDDVTCGIGANGSSFCVGTRPLDQPRAFGGPRDTSMVLQ